MSDRRRYLLSYDISDDKRRTRVFDLLMGNGDHTQYSVFVCELDRRELATLRSDLDEAIHAHDDQVLIVDLGPASRDSGRIIASLGRAYEPPQRALVI